MKILLADKQDITRAGLIYVIEKMEGLETKYVEDKTELMLALRENEDTVVILDYTLFDINDSAELLILNQRFPYTRWLLFSEDLSADFVRVLIASSSMFSVLLKESSLMEIKEAIRFCVDSKRFVCQRMRRRPRSSQPRATAPAHGSSTQEQLCLGKWSKIGDKPL